MDADDAPRSALAQERAACPGRSLTRTLSSGLNHSVYMRHPPIQSRLGSARARSYLKKSCVNIRRISAQASLDPIILY
jgi:hypothetical protein